MVINNMLFQNRGRASIDLVENLYTLSRRGHWIWKLEGGWMLGGLFAF